MVAPDAKSKALFWDNLVRLQDASLEECFRDLHDNFELYKWKTWRVLRLFKRDRIKLWIHGELPAEILARALAGVRPQTRNLFETFVPTTATPPLASVAT